MGGKELRRRRSTRTQREARDALRDLHAEARAGVAGAKGQTVSTFLADWLANLLPARGVSRPPSPTTRPSCASTSWRPSAPAASTNSDPSMSTLSWTTPDARWQNVPRPGTCGRTPGSCFRQLGERSWTHGTSGEPWTKWLLPLASPTFTRTSSGTRRSPCSRLPVSRSKRLPTSPGTPPRL